jgi:hypothetical protein
LLGEMRMASSLTKVPRRASAEAKEEIRKVKVSVAIQANRSFIKFEELSCPITYQNLGYFKPSFLPPARRVRHCCRFWISSILSAVGIAG